MSEMQLIKAKPGDPNKQETGADQFDEEEKKLLKEHMKFGDTKNNINSQLRFRTFGFYLFVFIIMFVIKLLYINDLIINTNFYYQKEEFDYHLADFKMVNEKSLINMKTLMVNSLIAVQFLSNYIELMYSNTLIVVQDSCTIQNISQCISDKESIYFDRSSKYYTQSDLMYFTSSYYQNYSEITEDRWEYIQISSNMDMFFESLIDHYAFINCVHKRFLCAFTDKKFIRNFPGSLVDDNTQLIDFAKNFEEDMGGKNPGNWIYQTKINLQYAFIKGGVLTIAQGAYHNNQHVGSVGVEIDMQQLIDKIEQKLPKDFNYHLVILDREAEIVLANQNFKDNFKQDKTMFSQYQQCICVKIKLQYEVWNLTLTKPIECEPKESKMEIDDTNLCEYIFFEPYLQLKGQVVGQYFILITSLGSQISKQDFVSIINVLWFYNGFFLLSLIQAYVTTSYRINCFTRDITNPIKQLSFKINRIMCNMFNLKIFQKIQTDDIVIKEETEIKQMGTQFQAMYKNLTEKGVFQNDFTMSLDSRFSQKSKNFQRKPVNDQFFKEVKDIIQKFYQSEIDKVQVGESEMVVQAGENEALIPEVEPDINKI